MTANLGSPAAVPPDAEGLFRLDGDALRCPFDAFDQLRNDAPVGWSEQLGTFVLSRAVDVHEVLRDPATFSSRGATGPMSVERMQALLTAAGSLAGDLVEMAGGAHPGLLLSDPPEHSKLRGLVNRSFTPSRVRAMEPFITQLANELLDAYIEAGGGDFVAEFAIPLPITVIARILGIPDEDLPAMKQWSKDMVILIGNHEPTRTDVEAFLNGVRQFREYVTAFIEDRRTHPRDDLTSGVAQAELDGKLVPVDVLRDVLGQFVTAGHDTTTALLGSGMHLLATNPALAQRLQSDLEMIPTFVEEVLRLESPIQGLFRTATVDTPVAGTRIEAEQQLLLLYAACNRDPAHDDQTAELDLERDQPTRHLAFGQGAHYCVGAPLARTEGRIAFDVLARRLLPLGPQMNGEVSYQRSFLLRGLTSLPLGFDSTIKEHVHGR